MKKIIIAILTLFLTFHTQPYTSPENKAVFQLGSDKFTLNKLDYSMDTVSFLENGRVFVPVRYLARACGIEDRDISWDEGTRTVTLNLHNKSLLLKVGSKEMAGSDHPVEMDAAPVIKGGRVFLPARWIAEEFDFKVEWHQASRSVLIYPRGDVKPHPPEKPAVLLVNKAHGLPVDYQPGPLDDFYGVRVSKTIMEPLRALFVAAGSVNIGINSGYRDDESQKQIFNQRVSQLGLQGARRTAAPPGYSEHRTGLAVDLGGDAKAYSWLRENCWRYGFILRYPKGCEQITGYSYEPWHFRYVGIPVASFMYVDSIQTLEEFVDSCIGN